MTSFGYCILVVLGLIVSESVLCNGGVTSSFVRKVEKTIDMPLDSDVFSVPPGHNAPQQKKFIFRAKSKEAGGKAGHCVRCTAEGIVYVRFLSGAILCDFLPSHY
ncbi:hypothetical protein KY285_034160 [Solanum tuberosum]|nr:hypothetical protein KY285_034160 [Solanum tuberosum]